MLCKGRWEACGVSCVLAADVLATGTEWRQTTHQSRKKRSIGSQEGTIIRDLPFGFPNKQHHLGSNVDHKSFVSYGSCISILESANLLCGNFPQAVHGTSVPPHYKAVPLFFANKLLVIKLDLGHFPEQQY